MFRWIDPLPVGPPKGMKVKKLSRDHIRFDNAISPAPYVTSWNYFPGELGTFTSTVMSVRKDVYWREITYDLMRADGYQFRIDRHVSLDAKYDLAFKAYLKANGIKGSYWHDYVGCQEEVTLDFTPPLEKDIIWADAHGCPPPIHGPVIEIARRFIYEPKGGARNASSR